MNHHVSRRAVLGGIAGMALGAGMRVEAEAIPAAGESLMIDTHQHLWDLSKFKLAWVENSSTAIYRKSYRNEEYLEATRGLNVKAVYMEVDMPADEQRAEAEYVFGLCREKKWPTTAAVIGGRPDAAGFRDYILECKKSGFLRGVRQVLHAGNTPRGMCLSDGFVAGIAFLGTQDLCFDLCMRPGELGDGLKLAERCAETRFVVDHCGNADPQAFGGKGAKPSHDVEQWKQDMEALGKRPNVICKISGLVARAGEGWKAADLAPIVNHCLYVFGPQKVVFGGDWPICLRQAKLEEWISALAEIVAGRTAGDRRKLWSENAVRFYGLESLVK
jgi:L-fuconolactonase